MSPDSHQHGQYKPSEAKDLMLPSASFNPASQSPVPCQVPNLVLQGAARNVPQQISEHVHTTLQPNRLLLYPQFEGSDRSPEASTGRATEVRASYSERGEHDCILFDEQSVSPRISVLGPPVPDIHHVQRRPSVYQDLPLPRRHGDFEDNSLAEGVECIMQHTLSSATTSNIQVGTRPQHEVWVDTATPVSDKTSKTERRPDLELPNSIYGQWSMSAQLEECAEERSVDLRKGKERVQRSCPICGEMNHIRKNKCSRCGAPKGPAKKRTKRARRKKHSHESQDPGRFHLPSATSFSLQPLSNETLMNNPIGQSGTLEPVVALRNNAAGALYGSEVSRRGSSHITIHPQEFAASYNMEEFNDSLDPANMLAYRQRSLSHQTMGRSAYNSNQYAEPN